MNDEDAPIRRMLTETTVWAFDKRALFVGIEVCEAAGGFVMRDLFRQCGKATAESLNLQRLVPRAE